MSLKSSTHFPNQARELATTFLLTNQLQRKSCIDRQTKNSRCVALPYRTLRPLIQRAQPRARSRDGGVPAVLPYKYPAYVRNTRRVSIKRRRSNQIESTSQQAYFRLKGPSGCDADSSSVGPTLGSGLFENGICRGDLLDNEVEMWGYGGKREVGVREGNSQ